MSVDPAWMKTAALFFFLAFWVVLLLRLLLLKRGAYDDAARIPLDDNRVFTPRETREPDRSRR